MGCHFRTGDVRQSTMKFKTKDLTDSMGLINKLSAAIENSPQEHVSNRRTNL